MEKAHQKKRTARFTSSKIVALTTNGRAKDSFGAPALTYIEEKRIERKMGRGLNTPAYSRAMAWGNFMERVCFDFLPLEYRMVSSTSVVHPSEEFQPYWSGACDFIVPDKKVSELKCYQPKAFAQYTECLLKNDVALLRKSYPQEYWQIVSNAIINRVDYGEAMSFMPTKKHAKAIQEMAYNYEGIDQWQYRFIYEEDVWKLPFMPDDSEYDMINSFVFEIPEEDIEFLNDRVRRAIEILNL